MVQNFTQKRDVRSYTWQRVIRFPDGRQLHFGCNDEGMASESDAIRIQELMQEPGAQDSGVDEVCIEYTEFAHGNCENCGEFVYLEKSTNTCQCGVDYDCAGNRLTAANVQAADMEAE